MVGIGHRTVDKEFNLDVIEALILHLSGAENRSDMQISKGFFPMCPVEDLFSGSVYISSIQPTRVLILPAVLATARNPLENVEKDFADLIPVYVRNIIVLLSEFQKPCRHVMSSKKKNRQR